MRLLHLTSSLSGGGAERQLSYLALEQLRLGHALHVAYLQDGTSQPKLPSVKLHSLKSRSNYDPYILWQLMRLIRQIKPDIIQTWILQMDIIGGIAAKITGMPWMLRESSSQMAYRGIWKHKLREKVVGLSEAIVSNSSGGDSYWSSHYPNKRRYVISNGLPLNIIDAILPEAPDNEDLRVCKGLLLYAGRIEALKNIDKLIEATYQVYKLFPIKLIICGDGPMHDPLERQVEKLGLSDVIRFAGFIDNEKLWAWMKYADVFCSLSDYEGLPNSVIEAMACGCPVVVSDIPAHREFLDENSALLVNQHDPIKIACSIQQSINDPAKSHERAKVAWEKVQNYSISDMTKAYDRVYKDVLALRESV